MIELNVKWGLKLPRLPRSAAFLPSVSHTWETMLVDGGSVKEGPVSFRWPHLPEVP